MFDDFLIRAIFAALGVSLAAGPMGCIVLWRRMAYFGDATAHAAILGLALALAMSISPFIGVLAICLTMALSVTLLSERRLANDALLGVFSQGALAAGLVAVSFFPGRAPDLTSFLFGDILSVSKVNLIEIWIGSAIIIALLIWRWNALLTTTLNPDLAKASGLNPLREKLLFTLALALLVAISLKVVGALLIAALLIIPSATARLFANGPERMAILASLLAACASVLGLGASLQWDTPAGPSIVLAAFTGFVLGQAITALPFFKSD